MKTERPQVVSWCPARCHIGEGLLPERSISM